MKRIPAHACFLTFAVCLATGCGSVHNHSVQASRSVFPERFVLDKERDLKETISGNEFVATLPGVHPVFGETLTIRVRGLQAESLKQKNPQRATRAYDQWLVFKRAMENAQTVELRNLERGTGGFWVWADLYLNGRLIK